MNRKRTNALVEPRPRTRKRSSDVLSAEIGWALAAVEGALIIAETHEGEPSSATCTAIGGVLKLAVARLRVLVQEIDEELSR